MTKKQRKKTANQKIFYPEGCKFFINLNNLISPQMIDPILKGINDDIINHLNDNIKGIKFLVGGRQWHHDQKGFMQFASHEIDFHEKVVIIFLSKIFKEGYQRWQGQNYGALKRCIWEAFYHEVVMCLTDLLRLNGDLMNEAKNFHLNNHERHEDPEIQSFKYELFNQGRGDSRRVNYIMILNALWNEPLPVNLGFLKVLYDRKLVELKQEVKSHRASRLMVIRYFNELRKLKLKYEFEYGLNELVNYCIHHKKFEIYYKHCWHHYGTLRRSFYYKAKRIILKFFKEHEIFHELKEYKDSANRTHYFLTHATFERVKSACFQACFQKTRNPQLEKFNDFCSYYSRCPICKQEGRNEDVCEDIYFLHKNRFFREILLEKMEEGIDWEDLNALDFYFGIPCSDCFEITKNIQGKYSDFSELQAFLYYYGECPICQVRNHHDYLLSFYRDERKSYLRNSLIDLMNGMTHERYDVNIGIPCCACFEEIFNEKPTFPPNNELYYS